MNVAALQGALAARGFDPGPRDGVPGRRTRSAIRAFQAASGLGVDGIAGTRTLAALALTGGGTSDPPWLAIARGRLGLREQADAAALAAFLASDGRTLGDPRHHPWCGDFVETCIAVALPDESLPANPYLARNWARFGRRLEEPSPGAVLVFWRGAPTGTADGHVGFYLRETADAVCVLGGNQSDRVSEAWITKARLLATRWPLSVPLPEGGVVRTERRTRLSIDER